MATEYIDQEVPAVGDRAGFVVFKPKVLDPAIKYRLVICLPGIGERGDGSDLGLDKVRATGNFTKLEERVRENGKFILIQVQPRTNYEHGEVLEAYAWAQQEFVEIVDWKKVYITGTSLGGGGTQRFLAENSDAAEMFAAAVPICPGGNRFFITNGETGYANIAAYAAKRPIWFFHSADDPLVKPSDSTDITIAKIKAINPDVAVRRTLYKYEQHGAWVRAYGYNPAATPTVADDYNDPIGGVLEFFELNSIGEPPKFLPRKSDPVVIPEPIPAPVVEPVPVTPPVEAPVETPVEEPVEPVPTPAEQKIIGFSFSPPPRGFFYVDVVKSDGVNTTKETHKVDANMWLRVYGDKWQKVDVVFKDTTKNIIYKP